MLSAGFCDGHQTQAVFEEAADYWFRRCAIGAVVPDTAALVVVLQVR